jgi:hypothetical protein
MKRNSVIIVFSGIFFVMACRNEVNTEIEKKEVQTVAPELGPAQELAFSKDTLIDSNKIPVQKVISDTALKMPKLVDKTTEKLKDSLK